MIKPELKDPFDLSNYELEPLHLPGCIQPHGVLLVLREPELMILQVSANSERILGVAPEALLGKPLGTLMEPAQIDHLKACLQAEDLQTINPVKIRTRKTGKAVFFDGVLHRVAGGLILELESAVSQKNPSFSTFYASLKGSIAKLLTTTDLQTLCQIVTEEVRRVSGFDRVMLYQFDDQWNGRVVAEAKKEGLVSYLTVHFPASDIPKQARDLYERNLLRLIVDADYQAAIIEPVSNPLTQGPLDLSMAVLRSIAPIHIEYLKNMGVSASMSISIMKAGQLWGLIACHHLSPRHVGYETRAACELLGQIVASQLSASVDHEEHAYEVKVKTIQARLAEDVAKEENVVDGLLKYGAEALELVNARGMMLCFENRYVSVGVAPDEEEVKLLLAWLQAQTTGDVFYTNALASLYPRAERYKEVASGILAFSISKLQRSSVIWFRPEALQEVHWGGDPTAPIEVRTDDPHLHPRKSFDLWKQVIRLTSLPWKDCEIAAATDLRRVIVDMALRDMILKQTLSSWLEQ